jgi:hypothetical protein
MKYLVVLLSVLAVSCNWAKEKTKETVNKTGEAVGKAGSEFADGLAKGVEKTFQSDIKFSDQLNQQGLRSGKVIINGTDSTTDNILTPYLIFDGNIDQQITVKVFTGSGQEYGRVTQQVKGQKGEAKYIDFVFDKRTNIDGKSRIVFE